MSFDYSFTRKASRTSRPKIYVGRNYDPDYVGTWEAGVEYADGTSYRWYRSSLLSALFVLVRFQIKPKF